MRSENNWRQEMKGKVKRKRYVDRQTNQKKIINRAENTGHHTTTGHLIQVTIQLLPVPLQQVDIVEVVDVTLSSVLKRFQVPTRVSSKICQTNSPREYTISTVVMLIYTAS